MNSWMKLQLSESRALRKRFNKKFSFWYQFVQKMTYLEKRVELSLLFVMYKERHFLNVYESIFVWSQFSFFFETSQIKQKKLFHLIAMRFICVNFCSTINLVTCSIIVVLQLLRFNCLVASCASYVLVYFCTSVFLRRLCYLTTLLES